MSQVTEYSVPGSPLNMAQLKTSLDAMFAAVASANRGSTAPDNPFEGMFWWDTSGNPVEVLKRYTVAAGWVAIISVNITTGAMLLQGYDADLATLSVPASTTISAFMKTVLDDADAVTARATLGVVSPVRNTARNLIIKNNATHPTYQVDIDADEIILQDSSGVPLRVSAVNLTADITVSGANGLDTGAEANIWYYIWVISNGTTTAGLLSASSTSPTMPEGYTFMAVVGAILNSSGDFISIGQLGNVVARASVTALVGGTETSFTSIDLTNYVPETAKVVTGFGSPIHTAATGANIILSSSSDGVLGNIDIKINGASGTQILSAYFRMLLLTPLTIWYKVASGTEAYVFVTGWEY